MTVFRGYRRPDRRDPQALTGKPRANHVRAAVTDMMQRDQGRVGLGRATPAARTGGTVTRFVRRIRDETGSASVACWLSLRRCWVSWSRSSVPPCTTTAAARRHHDRPDRRHRGGAAEHGSIAACREASEDLARRVTSAIHDVQVRCTRSATTVTVIVTGTPLSLITGFARTVTHTANVEVERLTGP